jgi:hypothetical protein
MFLLIKRINEPKNKDYEEANARLNDFVKNPTKNLKKFTKN